MIAKKVKTAVGYALILALGLGIGNFAPKIVEAFKPTYSEGNFAAYYPNPATKVIVFGTATCPFCAATRDYLNKRKIDFVDVNIADSETGRKQFADLKGDRVPLILVGNRRLVGFRAKVLNEALIAAKLLSPE